MVVSLDIEQIEYIWTKDETDVITTNITADNGSMSIDQFTSSDPELIQVAITIFSSYWSTIRVEDINSLKG